MKLILNRFINAKGQAAAVLNLLLALTVIIIAAGLCFELSRYFLARDELKTNTEAAALCCETALVSSGDPTNVTNQSNAVNTALTLFQQNSILGQPMTGASAQSSTSDLTPAPGQAQICFQFLDPITKQVIGTGGNNGAPLSGALIQATGAYCYTPLFSQFLGWAKAEFTFQVSAYSGVPRIDVVIGFDISGGGDYDTPITPIQRYGNNPILGTNPNTNNSTTGGTTTTGGPCVPSTGIKYMLPIGPNNQTFFGGTIADLTGHVGGGTTAYPHAVPPQQLENLANFTGAPAYSEQAPATQSLAGYNGTAGQAAYMNVAPGDFCPCPPSTPPGGGPPTPNTTYNYKNQSDFSNSHLIANAGSSPAQKAALNKLIKAVPDEDLQHLCADIDLLSGNKKMKNKSHSRKLDDRLSTISFVPFFSAFGANATYATTTSAGSTTVGGSPTTIQEPPVQVSSNWFTKSSHVTGAQGPFNDPTAIPGKCPGGVGPSSVSSGPSVEQTLTDLVANLDGRNVYWGNYVDANSFAFFDPGTLTEAARGNLESSATALQSFVDYTSMGVTPTTGYAAAYYNDAQFVLQPLDDMLYSATSLVAEMKNVADAHFSFIAFNDTAGNATTGVNPPQYANSQQTGYLPMISSLFPYAAPAPNSAGASVYVEPSLPFVALDPNNTNSDLMNQIPLIFPFGNRNVAAVLTAALQQLKTNGRPGANKAIILFCDGVPTEANSGNSAALQDAINAIQSSSLKVPVYCVCISDPKSTPTSDDTANDNAYGNSGGITGVSAPGPSGGPKYYRLDWSDANTSQTNLTSIVDNIVRQMVMMQGSAPSTP